MNYTVIPKSIVNFQTGNSKPVDIYVWATIKCCSNHKTNISHVTEEKLSLLTGLDERTIRRSIKRLKDTGYLTVQTTVKEDADRGFIKRNTYFIKPAIKDYFFLDSSFFKRNYPAKIAGFLLLLKAICLNNTDTVQWSISQIAKAIGLSRNTTTALIKECLQLGLIKPISNGYELTAGCFINSSVISGNSPFSAGCFSPPCARRPLPAGTTEPMRRSRIPMRRCNRVSWCRRRRFCACRAGLRWWCPESLHPHN